MSSSLFHKDLLVVPPEATFGPKGHTDDFITSHRLKKIFPENTATVKENSSIRFHLYGAGQHLDMRSVRLFFTAKMDTTLPLNSSEEKNVKEHSSRLGVAPIRFNDWIGSLFRTVEVRLNNQTLISRIDYRNVLHHLIGLYTVNEDWRRSVNGQNEGYFNSLCYRNTNGHLVPTNAWQKTMLSRTPTQYCIEFDLENIFKTQKYIPMDLVRSVDIELTTDYNHRVICRDHSNLGYGNNNKQSKTSTTPFIRLGHGVQLREVSAVSATDGGFVTADLQLSTGSEIKMKDFGHSTRQQLLDEVDKQNTADGWYGTQIGAGYSIDNYYITADFYQFNDAYRATLEQSLMEKGITFNMQGFINVTESLPTATRHEIRIRRSLTSVKSLYMSFELDSMIRNGLVKGSDGELTRFYPDALSSFQRFGLKSYQVLLNGVPIQGHRIDTNYGDGTVGSEVINAEHILETLKSFSTHGNHLVTGLDQASNKYQVTPLHGDISLDIPVGDVTNLAQTLTVVSSGTPTTTTYSTTLDAKYATQNANQSIARICSGDYMKDGVYYTSSDTRQSGLDTAPFILGVNLEKSSQVSGSSMQELVVLLDWDKTTPAGLMVHSFLSYDQHLEIRPGFDFVVHE